MGQFILALDQGTTSSRAIVFDGEGRAIGQAQQEFEQIYPKPGWVEHNPWDIWRTQKEVAEAAVRDARLAPADIAGIGITNQRETTIVWDRKSGEPIHNAIVWQCRRTADMCEYLTEQGFDKKIRERTGLVTDAYFSGTKIAWLLDHVKGARKKAEKGELAFGTVDSWLAWQMTEGKRHITDITNASRTLLCNIHTREWDDVLLKGLNIPAEILPEIVSSSGIHAYTRMLGPSIPLAGMAGDQHAALFGQACLQPGMAKNTYGTGCFVLMNVGDKPSQAGQGLLNTMGWQLAGQPATYATEGAIFVGGAVVQWLRDELGLIRTAAEVEKLAGKVPDSNGAFLVPAFVGLGAPYWDPHARGALVGLTRGVNSSHIARAALEAIALQSHEVLDCMQQETGIELQTLRVDGGASSNDLLMQMQADILGVPVERPRNVETTAMGAAWLAGLATGLWGETEELAGANPIERSFEPRWSGDQRQALIAGWRRAVERARDWARP